MKAINRILVIQTAFIGDVILTLPLIQVLKEFVPKAEIDVVVVPRAAELCRNHPAIERIIEYDKRGKDKGWAGFRRMVGILILSIDRKSTRLNSSHSQISYAVFC